MLLDTLVRYRLADMYVLQLQQGGHFAALERPQDLVRDVVEFVELVSK